MDARLPMLVDHLLLIERELRVLGWWSAVPPAPEALGSTQPFCIDTLTFEQWLQWVFLPRMHLIVETGLGLPAASGIRPMAEIAYQEALAEVVPLMTLLGAFDKLIADQ